VASVRDIFIRLGIRSDPKKLQQINRGIENVKQSAMNLGRVLATGALAVGFKKMIDVASDIEETANKFGAVFGEAGSDVQKQLDDIRKRTGATNMELQDMASNIGALVKPSLGSAEAAGKLGANIAEMALDIASFNNVTSADALVALRSGLIGSAEPLQRFGVDTRIAALELEAMRQGIGKSLKEMSEGERVQLRYAAIQRQLGSQGATGDATRTAKGFANASRNLGSAIKETAGIIGTFFLKSVGGLVNKTRELVDGFQSWLAANRELIQQGVDRFLERTGRVIGNVVDFFSEVISMTREWIDSLGPLAKQLIKIGTIVAGLALILLLPGGAILLLMALLGLLIDDFMTFAAGGESVIGDLVGWFKQLLAPVEAYREAAVATFRDMVTFSDEAKLALISLGGAIASVALAVGVKLVAANTAAIATFVQLKAIGAAVWLSMRLEAIKTAAITSAAQLKMGAGWKIAFGPIGIAVGLIAGLATAIGVMFADAVKETGSFGEAFKLMAKTTWDFWTGLIGRLGKYLLKQLVDTFVSIGETLGSIGGAIGRFFSGDGKGAEEASATAASPSGTGASIANNQQSTVNIDITAGPDMDAEKLAEILPPMIAREQEKVYRTEARNYEVAAAGAT